MQMRGLLKIADDIEVKMNLKIIARERGKIATTRDGHNIFLDSGREWIAKLIAYLSFGPDTPERDDRIKYMGVGIGGTRQIAPGVANSSPIGGAGDPYQGTNLQTDLDPIITTLERPVRIAGSTGGPAAGDEWIGQIQAPADHPLPQQTTFTRVFTQVEVSYTPFLTVPLSEIGLFTSAADPENNLNTAMAYDTFDTLSKTVAFELEVQWTFRF
jgi:hypothetical protein